MSVYHKAGNAEADEKMGLAALLAQSTTPGVAATGVLYGLAVTQTATASGSVQIGMGAGVVQASLTPGASLLYNPAPTLDIFTSHPVGSLPRNDIVVFDSLTGSISALYGTPNATPTDPTIPATALALARLSHAANATTIPSTKITDLRVYTFALGQSDSGWQNLDPTGDWTGIRRIRKINGVVFAKFSMVRRNTPYVGDFEVFGNLTSGGYAPTDNGGELYPGALFVNGNTSVRTFIDGTTAKFYIQGLNVPVGGNVTGMVSWPVG